MARTRTTKTRTTVEVVEATLDDLADDLLELSERSMKRVLYGALDEVAVPERAMRPAAVSMKRRMLRDRNRLEHQVLNRMWKDFVVVCVSEDLWTPPADASLAEIFRVTWRWPVIQTVSLERELKTMSELVLAGLYTPEDFVEDYMGADYKEHTRRWTENVARAKVQGSTVYDKVFAVDEEEGGVAADYMTVAEEEEAYERELVRSGRLDRSVLKRPAI